MDNLIVCIKRVLERMYQIKLTNKLIVVRLGLYLIRVGVLAAIGKPVDIFLGGVIEWDGVR